MEELHRLGLPIETGSGGQTKLNRTSQGYPKAHWMDAACVGESGEKVFLSERLRPLRITATGHGSRQMCRTDRYGFPSRYRPRAKSFMGYQTGDIGEARVPVGKYAGTHRGRITIRHRPSFVLVNAEGVRVDLHPKHLSRIHHQDGYAYFN